MRHVSYIDLGIKHNLCAPNLNYFYKINPAVLEFPTELCDGRQYL
jgi:hypothetical protein